MASGVNTSPAHLLDLGCELGRGERVPLPARSKREHGGYVYTHICSLQEPAADGAVCPHILEPAGKQKGKGRLPPTTHFLHSARKQEWGESASRLSRARADALGHPTPACSGCGQKGGAWAVPHPRSFRRQDVSKVEWVCPTDSLWARAAERAVTPAQTFQLRATKEGEQNPAAHPLNPGARAARWGHALTRSCAGAKAREPGFKHESPPTCPLCTQTMEGPLCSLNTW